MIGMKSNKLIMKKNIKLFYKHAKEILYFSSASWFISRAHHSMKQLHPENGTKSLSSGILTSLNDLESVLILLFDWTQLVWEMHAWVHRVVHSNGLTH